MRFFNWRLERIYKYIYIHSGETILKKDICTTLNLCKPTVNKWIKWLKKRELIKVEGKKFEII